MTKPRLTYFDFAGSRGEECRIALHLAGIEFDDVRIARADWPALKPKTPFGTLPVFELPGKTALSDTNAILVYIGRRAGLHPKDDYDAAFHETLMGYAEDLRHKVGPTMRITDEAEKRAAREELALNYLPDWGRNVEKLLDAHPFVGGAEINVVDIKLYMIVRWFASGSVDYIPATVFDHCPKLKHIFQSTGEHPGVKTWVERQK